MCLKPVTVWMGIKKGNICGCKYFLFQVLLKRCRFMLLYLLLLLLVLLSQELPECLLPFLRLEQQFWLSCDRRGGQKLFVRVQPAIVRTSGKQ
jgi:hypothetical protein